MGLFDFLGAKPHEDKVLGVLNRKSGKWQGSIRIGTDAVPLLVSGPSAHPDEAALELARALPGKYAGLQQEIQHHLFEHYRPYREAADRGELDDRSEPFPRMDAPRDVWAHARTEHVLIEPIEGVVTVEIGYRVAWDEEHTLGAWIREWRVFELCGSV